MITLKTFPGSFAAPSHSPYCVKAMCLLQLSGEPWQAEYFDNPAKMPYGKLPVAVIDGQITPDSGNIQRALEARGAQFCPGLSMRQRAEAHAIQRMAEESLSLGLVYERWMNDDIWPHLRETFFAAIPGPLRGIITGRLRKQVSKGLRSHGFARLNEADRRAVLEADLAAIEAMLAEGPYLFGTTPTAADASVLPLIDMFSSLPAETWVRERMRGSARLMGYVKAGRAAIYPGESTAPLRAAA